MYTNNLPLEKEICNKNKRYYEKGTIKGGKWGEREKRHFGIKKSL
jgi:hypothetical protein